MTGVQTCALPISLTLPVHHSASPPGLATAPIAELVLAAPPPWPPDPSMPPLPSALGYAPPPLCHASRPRAPCTLACTLTQVTLATAALTPTTLALRPCAAHVSGLLAASVLIGVTFGRGPPRPSYCRLAGPVHAVAGPVHGPHTARLYVLCMDLRHPRHPRHWSQPPRHPLRPWPARPAAPLVCHPPCHPSRPRPSRRRHPLGPLPWPPHGPSLSPSGVPAAMPPVSPAPLALPPSLGAAPMASPWPSSRP